MFPLAKQKEIPNIINTAFDSSTELFGTMLGLVEVQFVTSWHHSNQSGLVNAKYLYIATSSYMAWSMSTETRVSEEHRL